MYTPGSILLVGDELVHFSDSQRFALQRATGSCGSFLVAPQSISFGGLCYTLSTFRGKFGCVVVSLGSFFYSGAIVGLKSKALYRRLSVLFSMVTADTLLVVLPNVSCLDYSPKRYRQLRAYRKAVMRFFDSTDLCSSFGVVLVQAAQQNGGAESEISNQIISGVARQFRSPVAHLVDT